MEYVNFHQMRDKVMDSTDRRLVNCFSTGAEVLSNVMITYFLQPHITKKNRSIQNRAVKESFCQATLCLGKQINA